jgi:hypothetical protein
MGWRMSFGVFVVMLLGFLGFWAMLGMWWAVGFALLMLALR